jgi:hypothetical protein
VKRSRKRQAANSGTAYGTTLSPFCLYAHVRVALASLLVDHDERNEGGRHYRCSRNNGGPDPRRFGRHEFSDSSRTRSARHSAAGRGAGDREIGRDVDGPTRKERFSSWRRRRNQVREMRSEDWFTDASQSRDLILMFSGFAPVQNATVERDDRGRTRFGWRFGGEAVLCAFGDLTPCSAAPGSRNALLYSSLHRNEGNATVAMASPGACLDQSSAVVGTLRTRTAPLHKHCALTVGNSQTGINTSAVPPPSQRIRSNSAGRSRWDDHVSRIAVLLEEISLDEALRIAAQSLELSPDDSFNLAPWTRRDRGRDGGNYVGLDEENDDAASIDSEIRHLPGLQDDLFEELGEVDRMATICRNQREDGLCPFQTGCKPAVRKRRRATAGDDDSDSCSCDATSVTTSNEDSVTGAAADRESDCIVVDIDDEMSDLSSSFDSLDQGPVDGDQDRPSTPFRLLERPDLRCSSGFGMSMVVACDMMLASMVQSQPGGITTLSCGSGIVPNWLQSQLLQHPPTASLRKELWHRFVPVVGSCGFNNCGGSVLLLASAGFGPSGETPVE